MDEEAVESAPPRVVSGGEPAVELANVDPSQLARALREFAARFTSNEPSNLLPLSTRLAWPDVDDDDEGNALDCRNVLVVASTPPGLLPTWAAVDEVEAADFEGERRIALCTRRAGDAPDV